MHRAPKCPKFGIVTGCVHGLNSVSVAFVVVEDQVKHPEKERRLGRGGGSRTIRKSSSLEEMWHAKKA